MFEPITNPYIVGNPIKTKKMFYGREDDFDFIRRKLESGSKSYIIVLSGERRSGKTSILFQILNGQLGDNFIPILIDMQTMAGLKNESEFFEKFAQETLKHLNDRFSLDNYPFHLKDENPYTLFSDLLDEIHAAFPDKNKLFLIDEYELIETKSEEGSLSQNFVPFLSGVLESERHISFIFTGSRTLEERGTKYWQNLFGKSLFRNVSFLSEQDTTRLITQPIDGKITFEPAVLDRIYRLTSGQPFYSQIVGQNIVDFANETEKTHIEPQDLDKIVHEILENPLPQMIYFWNSLPPSQMLILSLLAEVLSDAETGINSEEIIKLAKKKKLGLSLNSHLINTVLETLYHLKYVSKSGNEYSFQIDLMRLWIQQDHSIWRVMKEVDIESIMHSERPSSVSETAENGIHSGGDQLKRRIWIALILTVIIMLAIWFISRPTTTGQSEAVETSEKAADTITGEPDSQKVQAPPQPKTESRLRVSEQGAVPQNPVQKKTNEKRIVETKRAEPPEPQPGASEANAIESKRNQMLTSKNSAIQAQAPELALETYKKGENTEDAAEKLVSQKQYSAANQKFAEAQTIFNDARSKSESILREAQKRYSDLELQLQILKKELKPEHKSLQEYQTAEDLQIKGKQFADQGNYNLANENYSEAANLYQSVVQKRIADTGKIQAAINGYARALEKKDIKNSVYIQNDYKSELQNQWEPFFSVAEDIKIESKIRDIEFNKNRAQVMVDVTMIYSGAGGSGSRNKWLFEIQEKSTNWIISKITKANQ